MAAESMAESIEDVESGEKIECGCREVTVTRRIINAMRALRKKDLKGSVDVVSSIGQEKWREICHWHIRAIASCWELKTSKVKREQLIERVMEVQRKVERLDELMD